MVFVTLVITMIHFLNMKKLILFHFFAVAILGQQLNAQSYIPFPTSNASWIDSKQCQENHYQITGDTLISNTTYHQLAMTFKRYQLDQLGDCDYNSYYNQTYPYTYVGSFRNDSASKRVYFIPKDSTTEKLLYDFNYNLGDTLRPTYARSYNFNYPNPLVVTKIDSMLISGRYHRTIGFINCSTRHASFPSDTLKLIEGIGSNSGLFSSYDICDYYIRQSMLYCHKQNSQIVYSHPRGNCNILTSTDDNSMLKAEAKFSIYPNPAQNEVSVKSAVDIEQIQFFDLNGRLLYTSTPFRTTTTIEMPDESGIYILKLTLQNGEVYSRKVIKG